MKKVLSLLLVTAMSLSLLAGCGGGDGNSSKSNGGANPSTSGTTVDTSNRKDLVICMPEEIETFDPISTHSLLHPLPPLHSEVAVAEDRSPGSGDASGAVTDLALGCSAVIDWNFSHLLLEKQLYR